MSDIMNQIVRPKTRNHTNHSTELWPFMLKKHHQHNEHQSLTIKMINVCKINIHLKWFVSIFQVLQKFSLFVHGLNHLWGEYIVCLIQNRMGPDLRRSEEYISIWMIKYAISIDFQEKQIQFVYFSYTSLGKFESSQSIFFRNGECLGMTIEAASPSS